MGRYQLIDKRDAIVKATAELVLLLAELALLRVVTPNTIIETKIAEQRLALKALLEDWSPYRDVKGGK